MLQSSMIAASRTSRGAPREDSKVKSLATSSAVRTVATPHGEQPQGSSRCEKTQVPVPDS